MQARPVSARTPLVVAQSSPIKGGRKHSASKGSSIIPTAAASDAAANVPYYSETGRHAPIPHSSDSHLP
jgi:hypothetical protein